MAYVQLASGTVLETSNPEIWPEAKRLSAKKGREILKEEARKRLLEVLRPGMEVKCVLRHVSKSGMSRRIDFFIVQGDDLVCITNLVANLCGYSQHAQGGLVVGGCGMDMGFAVVYELGHTLWPRGTDTPHGTRNGEPDSEGGYALKSRWI